MPILVSLACALRLCQFGSRDAEISARKYVLRRRARRTSRARNEVARAAKRRREVTSRLCESSDTRSRYVNHSSRDLELLLFQLRTRYDARSSKGSLLECEKEIERESSEVPHREVDWVASVLPSASGQCSNREPSRQGRRGKVEPESRTFSEAPRPASRWNSNLRQNHSTSLPLTLPARSPSPTHPDTLASTRRGTFSSIPTTQSLRSSPQRSPSLANPVTRF